MYFRVLFVVSPPPASLHGVTETGEQVARTNKRNNAYCIFYRTINSKEKEYKLRNLNDYRSYSSVDFSSVNSKIFDSKANAFERKLHFLSARLFSRAATFTYANVHVAVSFRVNVWFMVRNTHFHFSIDMHSHIYTEICADKTVKKKKKNATACLITIGVHEASQLLLRNA